MAAFTNISDKARPISFSIPIAARQICIWLILKIDLDFVVTIFVLQYLVCIC